MGPKSVYLTMKYLMTHYNRTGHNIASTSRVPVIVQFWNPERKREREREKGRERGGERGLKSVAFVCKIV